MFIKSVELIYKLFLILVTPYRNYKRRKVTHGITKLNILQTFPMYEAHGWGLYSIRAKLTVQSINHTIPAIAKFTSKTEKNKIFEAFLQSLLKKPDDAKEYKLKELFKNYGSDKSTTHNYYKVYAYLLKALDKPKKIFEIGLGTNNIDVVSTMGINGKPGASLRAFRDFQTDCQIYGADFDTRILFSEDSIQTYFVDQTKPETFEHLSSKIGGDFDLMIDDGLHSPHANLYSLEFFLNNIKIGGFAVIEDIHLSTKPIWDIVTHLIEANFMSAFIQTKSTCIFIVKREK